MCDCIMLYTYSFLGDVVAIDEPYICSPISDHIDVCHYNGCLKLDLALFPCPKCLLVCFFLSPTLNIMLVCIV